MAGVIMGTAAYMSPEQARGHNVDRRADIWAFGVVLYEMLTGEQLFSGLTVSDTLAQVLTKTPDYDRVPFAMRRVVRLCTVKDSRQRMQAIGDARIAMEEGETAPISQGMAPRHRAWPIVAVVLALALIAVSVLYWRSTRPAEHSLVRLSVDLGPEAVAIPRLITLAISTDGTRLVFVAQDASGKEVLATRRLDQPNTVLLAGTEGAAFPFFSPDGEWIGFFASGKMKKISVQGGAAVTLCDAPNGRGASWGGDGSIIATLTAGGGLSRVPSSGGTPQTLTKPFEEGGAIHRWPQILPGGQAVLFTGDSVAVGHDNASIEVLSLRTHQRKVVQRGGYFGRYLPSGHLVYVHQGTLFAVPFDLDRLETRGTPAPVLEDVAGNAGLGAGQFDFTRNGTFVYLSGKSSMLTWPIVWLDSDGKTQPLLPVPGVYGSPRFSPDGRRLALVAAGFDIEVYDWARATMTQLTFTGGVNRTPVWTPDGKHIVFGSTSAGTSLIQWIRSDGAGVAQTLLESKGAPTPYSFSPDGRRLAFAEMGVETNLDLWTLPLDTSDAEHPKPGKPELLLRTPAAELEPAFSPDGRWIAYTSSESGVGEIYVLPFPPGPGGKWLISAGGGRHPIWSRKGRELFYEGPDNRIMVASYAVKNDSFAPDKPRLWSGARILDPGRGIAASTLDLAPDGKRFAITPMPEGVGEQKGSGHVTFLLNFFDYLQRRVPGGGK